VSPVVTSESGLGHTVWGSGARSGGYPGFSSVGSVRSLRCWKTGVSGLVGSGMAQVIQMGGPEASPEVGPESPV
jgi:hypothetical protein